MGGLDLTCNCTFQESLDITMSYLENVIGVDPENNIFKVAQKGTEALKLMAYLPRQMLSGYDSVGQKYRQNNGPRNYEYQSLGSVSARECRRILGIESQVEVPVWSETEISEKLILKLKEML